MSKLQKIYLDPAFSVSKVRLSDKNSNKPRWVFSPSPPGSHPLPAHNACFRRHASKWHSLLCLDVTPFKCYNHATHIQLYQQYPPQVHSRNQQRLQKIRFHYWNATFCCRIPKSQKHPSRRPNYSWHHCRRRARWRRWTSDLENKGTHARSLQYTPLHQISRLPLHRFMLRQCVLA